VTNSDWPEVVVAATADTVVQLEEWLFAAGAVSVTYLDKNDQPILEPEPGEMRLWDDIVLVGLFTQASDTDSLRSSLHLAAVAAGMQTPDFQLRVLADAVWERAWMQDYKPMQFGDSLWICPSHQQPPDPAATIVHLDPGLAFGTGTHDTTALCLRWLGQPADTLPVRLKGAVVIDYGCGSGVLSIAAARLVIANILFEPLTGLAARFSGLVRPGGVLLMSGILDDQVDALTMRYNSWFDVVSATTSNGWALLSATRRPK